MTDKLLSLEEAIVFQQEAISVYEKCLARNLVDALRENQELKAKIEGMEGAMAINELSYKESDNG